MPVIQRIEDLTKVSQLTTGAILYCSQSGTPLNTNVSDIINSISGANVFVNVTSGQNLSNSILSLNIASNNTVYTTGNQIISGNKTFLFSLFDSNGISSLTTNSRQLFDATPNGVLDWSKRTLNNPGAIQALNWSGYFLKDSTNIGVLDWDNHILSGIWKINGTGIATSSELALTGTNLQSQINNLTLNFGVNKINEISGNINITGRGITTVTVSGQLITISGTNIVSGGGVGTVPSINITTNIDWSAANTFFGIFSGLSKTITFSNTLDGQTVVVGLSGFTTGAITWPTNVKWPNNVIPSPTSGAIDVYTFVKISTGIYATAVQNFLL